jgi:hypothetical protein
MRAGGRGINASSDGRGLQRNVGGAMASKAASLVRLRRMSQKGGERAFPSCARRLAVHPKR